MTLYQIDIPYACFGIEADGMKVVNAPPIARWMIGKTVPNVDCWVRRKGGTLTEVKSIEYTYWRTHFFATGDTDGETISEIAEEPASDSRFLRGQQPSRSENRDE